MNIIDFHAHVFNSQCRDAARLHPQARNPDFLARENKRLGISKSLLLASYPAKTMWLTNRETLALAARYPDFVPILSPDMEKGRQGQGGVKEVLALLKAGKGFGVKIYPAYHPYGPEHEAYEPLYDYCEARRLPVLIHTGDVYLRGSLAKLAHPLRVDEVCVKHPDLTVVLAHFGTPWFMDAAEVVYKNENAYADISGLGTVANRGPRAAKDLRAMRGELNRAINYLERADKVLFGSDFPVWSPADALTFTKSLDLNKKELENVLFNNAHKILRQAKAV